jgi:hypothetical protein
MLHWCQIISVPFGLVIDRKIIIKAECPNALGLSRLQLEIRFTIPREHLFFDLLQDQMEH